MIFRFDYGPLEVNRFRLALKALGRRVRFFGIAIGDWALVVVHRYQPQNGATEARRDYRSYVSGLEAKLAIRGEELDDARYRLDRQELTIYALRHGIQQLADEDDCTRKLSLKLQELARL
jgi:hypothetical protein